MTDDWDHETIYPGLWHERIVSFSIGNNIYYGLSYFRYSQDGDSEQDFWRYSTVDKEWTKLDKFPLSHTQSELFVFSIGNKAFLGYAVSTDGFRLWKFSEEKLTE